MFWRKKAKAHEAMEIREYIEVYSHFRIDLATLAKHDHFDLIEETVITRASIHDCVEATDEIDELTKLKILSLDKEWRQWITQNKQEGFCLVDIDRTNIPKHEWWFWVDMLEVLSGEDLKTL